MRQGGKEWECPCLSCVLLPTKKKRKPGKRFVSQKEKGAKATAALSYDRLGPHAIPPSVGLIWSVQKETRKGDEPTTNKPNPALLSFRCVSLASFSRACMLVPRAPTFRYDSPPHPHPPSCVASILKTRSSRGASYPNQPPYPPHPRPPPTSLTPGCPPRTRLPQETHTTPSAH